MYWLKDLFTNPYFMTPVLAWFVAQVIKTIIHAIENKKLDWSRMVGDGGLPSCHSATVASLAFYCLLKDGPHSFKFACTVILAIIVCHDAMGVRNEAGKHAIILNRLLFAEGGNKGHFGTTEADSEIDSEPEAIPEEKIWEARLKEFIGHSPVQVFAGVAVGIGMAILMYEVFLENGFVF